LSFLCSASPAVLQLLSPAGHGVISLYVNPNRAVASRRNAATHKGNTKWAKSTNVLSAHSTHKQRPVRRHSSPHTPQKSTHAAVRGPQPHQDPVHNVTHSHVHVAHTWTSSRQGTPSGGRVSGPLEAKCFVEGLRVAKDQVRSRPADRLELPPPGPAAFIAAPALAGSRSIPILQLVGLGVS
jgi:hypothetical protein